MEEKKSGIARYSAVQYAFVLICLVFCLGFFLDYFIYRGEHLAVNKFNAPAVKIKSPHVYKNVLRIFINNSTVGTILLFFAQQNYHTLLVLFGWLNSVMIAVAFGRLVHVSSGVTVLFLMLSISYLYFEILWYCEIILIGLGIREKRNLGLGLLYCITGAILESITLVGFRI